MASDGRADRVPLAVFDIDGVVADVRHRLPHLARRPKDWRGFFRAAADDPPLDAGIALAREYAADHDVVWLTGRPEHLRRVTERWLRAHDLPVGRLLMRRGGDYRPSRVYKVEALTSLAKDAPVAVVVDDDPEVIKALKPGGWPVRLADWVPYAEPLKEAQEKDGRT
jgi:hypothetical protein